MTRQEYIATAWGKISHKINSIDKTDIENVTNFLNQYFDAEVILTDAVRCCMLTERLSPQLTERYACDRMSAIHNKYLYFHTRKTNAISSNLQ